jgi:thiamine pyrophosphate-dependent acetolactate synthase large subunit-like protein
MTSPDVCRRLTAAAGDDPIVASLGHPAYDLFEAQDRPANFYTWGSMGLASSVSLGLALAQPSRRVFVLDGDGSLLMNLGSLASIGWTRPSNLILVVIDNERYGTTGGQETATAHGADLEAAARAMGITAATTVRTIPELDAALTRAGSEQGPSMVVAKIVNSSPVSRPPLDCVFIKQRFMAAIGCPEAATTGGSS